MSAGRKNLSLLRILADSCYSSNCRFLHTVRHSSCASRRDDDDSMSFSNSAKFLRHNLCFMIAVARLTSPLRPFRRLLLASPSSPLLENRFSSSPSCSLVATPSASMSERGVAMGEDGNHSISSPPRLRILFCGDEFVLAEVYTRQYLQQYPHLQLDSFSREEVPDRIGDYDICVPRMMRLDAAVIARATRLQLILQFGVGLEGVDIDAATRAGIKVARIPSAETGNALSCAEHVIYMILGLLRHQKDLASSIAAKRLGFPAGTTLFGKTVFILGYGHIGKELAPRLRCFGVHILAVRRSWNSLVPVDSNNSEGLQNGKALDGDDSVHEKGGMDRTLEFASRADIVVTCCTLNPTTKGIINSSFLARMKKGAYVVNVARGGLLDYDAVVASLKSGHLGGLALDVAWSEPFDPSDPILQFSNVLITPHVAGVTTCSYDNMGKLVADCANQLSKGMAMPGIEFAN